MRGMSTAMKNARIMREHEAREDKIKLVVEGFYNQPTSRHRILSKTAKVFLLRHNSFIIEGISYTTHTKFLGAGVHELYLKKATNP